MATRSTSVARVLALEAVGIAMLILLIWANEYIDLPHVLFDEPITVPRAAEFALESGIVLAFGAGVMVTSFLMLRRLRYLESLLTLCASCHRIGVDGEWMSFERLVQERDHLSTTHGICADCYAVQTADLSMTGQAAR